MQEKQIIHALLRGDAARDIARWVRPPVTHVTVWRYFLKLVKPTMANAEGLVGILPPGVVNAPVENKAVTTPSNGPSNTVTRSNKNPPTSNAVTQMTTDAILGAPLLAIRENRIAAQEDRHKRLQMVMHERARSMPEVPGGKSGLLTRDGKGIYKVDGTLLAEFREHEKQIATELGQWQENVQGNVSIQIVVPPAGSGAVPRISYVSDDAIESEEIGLIQQP